MAVPANRPTMDQVAKVQEVLNTCNYLLSTIDPATNPKAVASVKGLIGMVVPVYQDWLVNGLT